MVGFCAFEAVWNDLGELKSLTLEKYSAACRGGAIGVWKKTLAGPFQINASGLSTDNYLYEARCTANEILQ